MRCKMGNGAGLFFPAEGKEKSIEGGKLSN